HARHVAMPLREQRQQRLVDAIDLGAHILLGDAFRGGLAHERFLRTVEVLLLVCTASPTISTLDVTPLPMQRVTRYLATARRAVSTRGHGDCPMSSHVETH